MCTLHNIRSLWFWGTIRLNMWGVRFISRLCIDLLHVTCTPVSWAVAPNLQQHLWSGATVSTSEFYYLPCESWHFTPSVQRPQQKMTTWRELSSRTELFLWKHFWGVPVLLLLTYKRGGGIGLFWGFFYPPHSQKSSWRRSCGGCGRTAINTGSLYGLSCVVVVVHSSFKDQTKFPPEKIP